MDDEEMDYIIAAIHFVASKGHRFLSRYDFELATGSWSYRGAGLSELPACSLEPALSGNTLETEGPLSASERHRKYWLYLADAAEIAERLIRGDSRQPSVFDDDNLETLRFFSLPQ